MQIEDKKKLRELYLGLLRNQNEQDRLIKSRLIQEKLIHRPEFQAANTILFYASFDGEVDTFPMMKQANLLKKSIALPVVTQGSKNFIPSRIKDLESLNPGPFGIQQPIDAHRSAINAAELDLVIVPGLCFDRLHFRLGRGFGFYDRFLASLPKDTPCLGVAFDFQMVERLPHLEAHDIALTDVIFN